MAAPQRLTHLRRTGDHVEGPAVPAPPPLREPREPLKQSRSYRERSRHTESRHRSTLQTLPHADAAQRQFTLSKQLITILRHTAPQHGISLRSDGYYSVRDILSPQCFRSYSCALDAFREIVANDSKGRFQITQEGPQVLIRATRGHSLHHVRDDELYTEINITDEDLPATVVHCIYKRDIESIRQHGLFAGGWGGHRNHMYFSPFLPTDPRGYYGRRTNYAVIYVDIKAA